MDDEIELTLPPNLELAILEKELQPLVSKLRKSVDESDIIPRKERLKVKEKQLDDGKVSFEYSFYDEGLEQDEKIIKGKRAQIYSRVFEPLIDKYFKEVYKKDIPPLWFDWEKRGGIPIPKWEKLRFAIASTYAEKVVLNPDIDLAKSFVQLYKDCAGFLSVDIRNREVYAKYYPITETLIRGISGFVGGEGDLVYDMLYKDTQEAIRTGDIGDVNFFKNQKLMKQKLLFVITSRFAEIAEAEDYSLWVGICMKLDWDCDDILAVCWYRIRDKNPDIWTYDEIIKDFRLDYMGLTPDALKKRMQRVRKKLGI